MEKFYLVIYDIADHKRLMRVASIVSDYGERVQKSVFEVSITQDTFKKLCKRLLRVIDQKEDGIKIIPLCESCKWRRLSMGEDRPQIEHSLAWCII